MDWLRLACLVTLRIDIFCLLGVVADEDLLIPRSLLGISGTLHHVGNVVRCDGFARMILLESIKLAITDNHHNVNVALVRDLGAFFLQRLQAAILVQVDVDRRLVWHLGLQSVNF